ncbi:MAG: A/G-specific adenine glycosylase [Oscillospiraceae bacterium]|nr:A/G-specific adenine glycosylase [Oscillospiraceae bacterium]
MGKRTDPLTQLPIPLLEWYGEHARQLPWRSDPTAYHVWVSEIMLQQTRVAAVLDYYRRFMDAAPTVADLARMPDEQLMKLWQGLGYYSRARNLKRAAVQIVARFDGQFPDKYEDIRALPGVGDYTAGAIASIAFGQAVPAVDGNVLRVVTRLTANPSDITLPATKRQVAEKLGEIIPTAQPGQFNQAMMELGATVCIPNGAPLCDKCPAAQFCLARQKGLTAELPVKTPKKARRIEERTVFLIFRGNKVALRQRGAKGLLAGLWEFPNEHAPAEDALKKWGVEGIATPGDTGRHIFTHIEWHMSAIMVEAVDDRLPHGWVWASRQELDRQYAVPNAFRAFETAVRQQLGYF